MPAAGPVVRRLAHLGVLGCALYAVLKGAWGLGSRIGVTDDAAFDRFVHAFGAFEWLATWGTVALAGVAAVLLLALVEPWGARLPRRSLRVAAWLGAAVLLVPGVGGFVEELLVLGGVLADHDDGLADWVFLVVYGSFTAIALGLAVAAAVPHTRRRATGVASIA